MKVEMNSKTKLVQDLINISIINDHYMVGEPFNIYLKDVYPSFISTNYSLKEIIVMIEMNSKPNVTQKLQNLNVMDIKIDENPTSIYKDPTSIVKDKLLNKIMLKAKKKNISFIGEGYNIFFDKDEKEDILDSFNLPELKDILIILESTTLEDLTLEREENEAEINEKPTLEFQKKEVLNEIMLEVESKFILYVDKYKIDFELDTNEDLYDSFNINELKNILSIVQEMSRQIKDGEEFLDVLEIVDRFKEGAIKKEREVNEKLWWRKNYPKGMFLVTDEDTVYTVYDKAKDARDTFDRNTDGYTKMYEFMHELSEDMYPLQEDTYKDTQSSEENIDAAEYVRACVEAIVLPHHEAIDKFKKTGGKIAYGNLWNTHFSESLKKEVRSRDNNKCVVCYEEKNLHVHHKIPRNLGGIHHKHNLVTLCSSCHSVIETGDLERAFKKCLSNYLLKKIYMQRSVDLKKDVYILKQEVIDTLESVLFTLDNRNEQFLVDDLIGILKKVDYIFSN